jgi:hypothetical protein
MLITHIITKSIITTIVIIAHHPSSISIIHHHHHSSTSTIIIIHHHHYYHHHHHVHHHYLHLFQGKGLVTTHWLLSSIHPLRSPVVNTADQSSPSTKRRPYKNGHWCSAAESGRVNEGLIGTPENKARRKNKIGFDDRLYGAEEMTKITT